MGWQPTMNGARFFIAEAEKLFAKEGLDVNLIKFTAGPPFFAAFQSESIDVGFMGIQPAVTAIAQEIPVKIFAIENDAGSAEGLVARQDSGIRTLADMRGKSIATTRGSSADTALHRALDIAGLKTVDLNIVDLDVTSLMPAFTRGDIQAGWYWEPWMGLLKREGGQLVATDRDIAMPSGILWVARTRWLQQNLDAVLRLLHILDIAAARIREAPNEVSQEVAKLLDLKNDHVLEFMVREGSWPTNRETYAQDYPFSMHPQVIAAGKGIAGVMTDNAKFQKSFNIVARILERAGSVPDYTKAVDPAPLMKYLESMPAAAKP